MDILILCKEVKGFEEIKPVENIKELPLELQEQATHMRDVAEEEVFILENKLMSKTGVVLRLKAQLFDDIFSNNDIQFSDESFVDAIKLMTDVEMHCNDVFSFLFEIDDSDLEGDLEDLEDFTHHNINKEDGGYYTPLMRAVESGDLDKVKYLVEKGADINHKSSTTGATTPHGGHMPHFGRQFSVLLKNQTTLHIAVSCQQVEIIKYLLENGADMYAKDGCNAVPLFRVLIRERSRRYFPNHDASPEDFIKQILPIFLEHGYNIQHSTMLSRIYYRNYNPQIKENTVNILDLASLVNCSDIHKFIVMNSID